jgi:hypothetical protein
MKIAGRCKEMPEQGWRCASRQRHKMQQRRVQGKWDWCNARFCAIAQGFAFSMARYKDSYLDV